MDALLFIIVGIVVYLVVIWATMGSTQKTTALVSGAILGMLYFIPGILFLFGMITHTNPYYQQISPTDFDCYSPFSDEHLLTLIVYHAAFFISALFVWKKGNTLPPLALILCLVFILIGIILSGVMLFHFSEHDTRGLHQGDSSSDQLLFIFAPLCTVFIGAWLLVQTIRQEITKAHERSYRHPFLRALNTILTTWYINPLLIIILLLPLLSLVTILLILLGQEPDSLIKVFTNTTTWRLSQQQHPPVLDHSGHYLCTVAASGDPHIVKPLRFGQRKGKRIIVNRQLLIANAFEELVQDISPTLHRILRSIYDTYGYNLSRKINTPRLSNLTYILMKPAEWFFLFCLYLLCRQPEQKIKKQYAE